MADSYDPPGSDPDPGTPDPAFDDLDEFLCEYVDETMDPAVRAAFDEIVAQNPALAAHVARLRRTRQILCGYGCRMRALRHAAARRTAQPMPLLPDPAIHLATRSTSYVCHLNSLALLTSTAALVLLFALLAADPMTADRTMADRPEAPRALAGTPAIPVQAAAHTLRQAEPDWTPRAAFATPTVLRLDRDAAPRYASLRPATDSLGYALAARRWVEAP